MAPPIKSSVWSNFVKIDNGGKCKLCHCIVKTKGNTTNLSNHMKRHHSLSSQSNETINKDRNADRNAENMDNLDTTLTDHVNISTSASLDLDELNVPSTSLMASTPKKRRNSEIMQPQIDDTFRSINSFHKGGVMEGKVTNALLYLIAADDLPLNSTEKRGLKHLMKTICPHYSLPSRTLITKLMDEKYDCLSDMIKNKIKNIESFCLTTDVWTDTMNTRSYLGLTCHYHQNDSLKSITIGVFELSDRHTSQYLTETIKNLCTEWHIEEQKILAIVTDSGANIVKSVHDFVGRKKHLPCFAHTLNSAVKKATDDTSEFETLISKVKEIVTYFKHSVRASDELHKLQKSNNVAEKKLIQSVSTRWNSTFYMLERFIELSEYIGTVLLQNARGPSMITGTEMAIIKEIINILRPIENVTREISAEDYVTSSIIIPIIYCMTKAIEATNTLEQSDIGSEFKAKILAELRRRFQNVEKVHILGISTLLDPRFKKMYFTDAQACAKAISEISDLLKSQTCESSRQSVAQSVVTVNEETDGLWQFHNQLLSQMSATSETRTPETLESSLKQYLSEPLIDRKANPITYWRTRKIVWQQLGTIALRYLAIVATSTPSERLFSLANITLNESRNRLLPKRLSKLLFLKSLGVEDWHL